MLTTKGIPWILGSTLIINNGGLWDARWQQSYKVNFHCLRSSERAHMTENNEFYLVSLLPPSVQKVSHLIISVSLLRAKFGC